jgi:sec-independent protein translocase protein TatA
MTTGLLSPVHIGLLLAVAVMLFGAKRLPDMGKSLGTGLRGFRHSLEGIVEDETPQFAAADQVATQAPAQATRRASQPLEAVGERPGPGAAA